MVKIITDSCCDLSPEIISRYDVEVIPLSVLVHGVTHQDGVDLNAAQLFEAVKKYGELPKTSAPSVAAFSQVFTKHPDFIYIGISSKLSATFQSAHLALEALGNPRGRLIDSLNLSTGIGLLVIRAAELSREGKTLDEIVQVVESLIPKTRSSFVIDTLDYLHMGGRCSSLEHVVGSLLKLRPVIEVRPDGTLGVREKVSGSRRKALNALVADFFKHKDAIDPKRVFITHAASPDDALTLKGELGSILNIGEILITEAGSTISSHCGPNTIGILYQTL